MLLSIIVPVYNEQDSLEELVQRIEAVATAQQYSLDIWFIDDGSRDASWQRITQLASTHSRVHGLKLRRNFGKAAALSAGFDHAQGDRLITMDADLQDDPNEIPALLAKIDEGFDVVTGWKQIVMTRGTRLARAASSIA